MSDLISRQAAIDAIYRCTDIYVGNLPIMVDKEDAYKAIAQLPTAEPRHDCNTCRYNNLKWHEEPCDSCTGGGKSNHWKPSADVVEVVRCKDCKFSDYVFDSANCTCNKYYGISGLFNFCGDGERREE